MKKGTVGRKRLWRLGTAALILAVALTGCGGGDGKTEGESGASSSPVSDVTITVGASQNWVKDIDRKLAQKFTDETGIKVDFQVSPDDQYSNIIKTKLATNEAPDLIYLASGISMEDYQPDKNFKDLSAEPWVANYRDWAKQGATLNGKVYGINLWSVDGWGLLYNTKIFEKYSLQPPKNFQEFLALCETLKQNGITPIYDNTKDSWHNAQWLVAMAAAMKKEDPQVFDKLNSNEKKFADSAVLTKALADFKTLYDKGYFGKNALANEWLRGYEAMGSEKYAMILVYTTYQKEIAEKFPNTNATDWKMFPVPIADNTGFAYAAGILRAVNAKTQHYDAVREYFEFLTRKENLESFYKARTDLGEVPFKDVEVNPPTNAYQSVTAFAGDNTSLSLIDTTKFIDTDRLGKAVQDMLIGQLTPEQVLQKFDENRQRSFEIVSK